MVVLDITSGHLKTENEMDTNPSPKEPGITATTPDLELREKEVENDSIPSAPGSHANTHKLRQVRTHP